jgi:hypothetical protein
MEPIQRRRLDNLRSRPTIGGTPQQRPTGYTRPVTPQNPSPSALRPIAPAGQHNPASTGPSALRPPTPVAKPAVPAQPSMFRPPTGPSMDFRPATPTAHVPGPQSTSPQPTPSHTPSHSPTPAVSTAQASSNSVQPARPATQSTPESTKVSVESSPKPHKEPHPTAHAGLVGFITFVVVGSLLLAPIIPGKIWDTAPGSWQSFSTGDQAIDCVSGSPTNTSTTTRYNSKNGFPVVYQYTTTSTMTGSCGSQVQHAVGGHTSQFNPLGLLIDTLTTLAIAIIVAKLWRRFRGVRS